MSDKTNSGLRIRILYAAMLVVVVGVVLLYEYGILPEGRMVIKALLEGSIKGVGKHHRTPIFPCGIFQVGEGINKHKGDPNYDLFQLALKSTSLRLYPNYANIDWSGNAGYDRNDPRTYFSTINKTVA